MITPNCSLSPRPTVRFIRADTSQIYLLTPIPCIAHTWCLVTTWVHKTSPSKVEIGGTSGTQRRGYYRAQWFIIPIPKDHIILNHTRITCGALNTTARAEL